MDLDHFLLSGVFICSCLVCDFCWGQVSWPLRNCDVWILDGLDTCQVDAATFEKGPKDAEIFKVSLSNLRPTATGKTWTGGGMSLTGSTFNV